LLVDWADATKRLSQGEIGVLPTDTLYGLTGSALQPVTVERIYAVRRRELDKPLIVLVGGWSDFDTFHLRFDDRTQKLLNKVWPGPVSVVLKTDNPGLAYLHRGTGSIAFRMPRHDRLRQLIRAAGPVVAPSANWAGEPPATTIEEAHTYFGDDIFYVDEGVLNNPASALVDARTEEIRILRPAPGFKLE
jgi:L-threonylcarbamoyladenylate synthase